MCPYSEASFKEQCDIVGSTLHQISCRDLNEMTRAHVCTANPDRNEEPASLPLSESQKLTQYIIYAVFVQKTDVLTTHCDFKVGLTDSLFELLWEKFSF